ncbi:hypothetical protein ABPG77_011518 [Micractinium sp. CCAP 211/92]
MVVESFAGAVHALADALGPLSDDEAREFMRRFPLDAIFRELSAPAATAEVIDATCAALGKVFDTSYGASLLPGVLEYAAAAARSPSAPLRRLAAQQTGRLLAAGSGADAAGQQEAAGLLLQALQDSDVGVAVAAEAGLKQLASPAHVTAAAQQLQQQQQQQQQGGPLAMLLSAGSPARQALRRLAACDDPLLRMRCLTLLVALAAQSPAAAAAVRQSGLLESLLDELRDPDDLLSCMAALQLVRDAAEQCDAGMALALLEAAMPRLAALLSHPEPVLQSGALKAAASLLGASLEAGPAPMALDGPTAAGDGAPEAGGAAARPLLAALKDVLDVGGAEELPAELEEAALDAVGILGLQRAGAEALLSSATRVVADVAYKALGRAPSPAQRVAALHALATLAGAERAGRSGKLCSPAAEAALRVAVFEGAAASAPGATPAGAFVQQLGQPFLEQRVAVYRCLAALAARDWAAGQACAHSPLLDHLLDPTTEASKQGCEWRHACVVALAATIEDVRAGGLGADGPHAAALTAAADRVEAAARAGPYGAGRAGPAEHVVATMPGA